MSWNDQNRIGIEVEIPDYVVTEDELSAQSYATQTYVVNYVDEHGGSGGSIDLSSYVSYSYLESKHYLDSVPNDYPTYAAISEMGYITASDVPTPDLSTYVSKNELSSQAYVTDTALENAGYLTYIISRDIRPDTTGRWNFGSVDYVWDSTYQRNNYLGTKARIYGTNSYEIWVGFGTGTYYYVNRTRIQPNGTTQADLGSSSNNWQNTYTKKLYLNNTDIETRLSAYVSKTDLSSQSYVTATALDNASYASQTYVADYVAEHGSSVDLSSYVSKDELSAQSYVSQSQLDTAGYITSIPSEYITENDLSACGYITIDDVAQMGYITIDDVPVIDENIIPKETGTYTLGTLNKMYAAAYTAKIGASNNGLWIDNGGAHKYFVGGDVLRPYSNNNANLGSSAIRWKDTYSYNYNFGYNTYITSGSDYGIQMGIVGKQRYQWNMYQFTMIDESNRNVSSLGTSGQPWGITYTKQLYLDGTNIEDRFSTYVTKTDLSNAGYITSIPSEYITQAELSANGYLTSHQSLADYPTYSYVSDNYLKLTGGTLTGDLTLGNTYCLTIGTQRNWKIFEDGSGSGAYICLQASVAGKTFFIRDLYGNNIARFYNNNSSGNYVRHDAVNTYTNNIIPTANSNKNLGSSSAQWAYSYTQNLILDGTDINDTIDSVKSIGKVHIGTAVTSSTASTAVCTVTVDTFELDSNNKPLAGTQIAFKVTSATSVNGVAMKLNVNSTGDISMYYDNAVVTATSRNWYRDCTRTNAWYYFIFDGTYWVWQNCSSENNNTYSNMTDANMQAGTETTARLVTAKALATYYTAKSCFTFDSSTNTLTITTT